MGHEHLVGYITIALSIVTSFIIVVLARISWNKNIPKEFINGIGIRYIGNAERNWEGLEETIVTISDVLKEEFPDEDLMKFWIDVIPHDGKVSGFTIPSGTIGGKQINGTVNSVAFLGIFEHHFIIVVRQIKDANGTIKPAYNSTIIHEVAEHYVPFKITNNWNQYHNILKWTNLRKKIEGRVP